MFTLLAHELKTGAGRGWLVSMLTSVYIFSMPYIDLMMSELYTSTHPHILLMIAGFSTQMLTHCSINTMKCLLQSYKISILI